MDLPGLRFETKLWGEPRLLTVLKPLGSGSYGTVYLVAVSDTAEAKALKRINDSSPWEVYIRQQITLRVAPFDSASPIPPIMPFDGAFLFQDSTLIAMSYYEDARLTAFQILNVHRLQGSAMPGT